MQNYELFPEYSLSGTGEYIKHITNYVEDLNKTLAEMPFDIIDQVTGILHEARMSGKQVFIMGNGGSAATASHFVADLAKNTRRKGYPGFRSIALTDNMPIFSAFANDEGYDTVFTGQLQNLVFPRDVIIAISGSGNSMNVVKAVEYANQIGAQTISFTGFDGGKLGKIARININIDNDKIQVVEDAHMALVHIIGTALMEVPRFKDAAAYEQPVEKTLEEIAEKVELDLSVPPEEVHEKIDEIQLISKEFAQNLNLHELLPKVLSLTLEMVGAVSGSIVVMDKNHEVVDGALVYSGQEQTVTREYLCDIKSKGLAGWVIENRQSALVNSTRDDDRWLDRGREHTNGSRSAVSVPLMTQDRVVGVVTLVHPQADRFNSQDLALLTAITMTISYSVSSAL